ncbi:hypothetical protein [Mesorhizobium sp. M7A.T.Ca.TU.009.02.1.1]|uniref:hypothetical protein n=1 Tax=Mesorhizobium sp. M7A.T.Ca.TU.009.02.1.1 TaxID=2496791 RepID=UPI001FDFFF3F|nr:hypothetical protein [Mesorhizobium sp. M7A.T.Ca.TU.009.02.1.1]
MEVRAAPGNTLSLRDRLDMPRRFVVQGADLSGRQANADFNLRLTTRNVSQNTAAQSQKQKTRLGGGSVAQLSTMGKNVA